MGKEFSFCSPPIVVVREGILPLEGELEGVSFFISFYLIRVGEEEIDIVVGIHQAVLLVAVDGELLAMACREIRYGLVWHIHLHFGFRILLDRLEEFLLKLAAHNNGQNEAIQQVIAMDVGKTAAYHHSCSKACNRPSSMLATRARAPVLPAYDDFVDAFAWSLRELRLVHYEVWYWFAFSIIAKVVHECLAIELGVARGEGKITCRDDVIRVVVVNLDRNAS